MYQIHHKGTGTGTGMCIFYKCGYGEGHCSTLLIGYPLSSLHVFVEKNHYKNVFKKITIMMYIYKKWKQCIIRYVPKKIISTINK